MRDRILYYAVKYQGEWHQITKAIAQQEPWHKIPYEGNYVTLGEEAYPKNLHALRYAPWILFYEGDIDLLEKKCAAIIGARQCDAYGKRMTNHICNILKEKYVIVSGVAKGIDAYAHEQALQAHTVGVIGCGLDVQYPKENKWLYDELKQHHLLLSEYPKGVKPLAYHFPWRNRILAALSDAIVVVQANVKSGTLLTVNEALELDKEIYCVPHEFKSSYGAGCNLLISQGANILVDDDDIFAI